MVNANLYVNPWKNHKPDIATSETTSEVSGFSHKATAKRKDVPAAYRRSIKRDVIRIVLSLAITAAFVNFVLFFASVI